MPKTVRASQRQSLLDYRNKEPLWLRRKAGTLAIRLRVLYLVYFEKTGELLYPLEIDQILKPMEGLAAVPRPPRPRRPRKKKQKRPWMNRHLDDYPDDVV